MLSCLGTTKHTASLGSSESPSDAKNSESMKLQEVSAPPPDYSLLSRGNVVLYQRLTCERIRLPQDS
jgi:hypothetical protein